MSRISADSLQEGLRTKRFGRSIFFLHKISSTNDFGKRLAAHGAIEGTVVIAETQTSGRGRLGRKWFSPIGGLWFSVILKPSMGVTKAARLVFVAGLAVAETLNNAYGLRVETRWPNDVLVNGRKVCGILTETNITAEKVNFVVVGVGINANFIPEKALPATLRKTSTSLERELGHKVQLELLFRALLENIDDKYDLLVGKNYSSILEGWKKYAGFLGRQVEVSNETRRFSGLALDVDYEGALVLRLDTGETKRVLVGDISLRTK